MQSGETISSTGYSRRGGPFASFPVLSFILTVRMNRWEGGEPGRRGGQGASVFVWGPGAEELTRWAWMQAGAEVDLAGFVGHDGDWLRSELGAFGVGIELVGADDKVRRLASVPPMHFLSGSEPRHFILSLACDLCPRRLTHHMRHSCRPAAH